MTQVEAKIQETIKGLRDLIHTEKKKYQKDLKNAESMISQSKTPWEREKWVLASISIKKEIRHMNYLLWKY